MLFREKKKKRNFNTLVKYVKANILDLIANGELPPVDRITFIETLPNEKFHVSLKWNSRSNEDVKSLFFKLNYSSNSIWLGVATEKYEGGVCTVKGHQEEYSPPCGKDISTENIDELFNEAKENSSIIEDINDFYHKSSYMEENLNKFNLTQIEDFNKSLKSQVEFFNSVIEETAKDLKSIQEVISHYNLKPLVETCESIECNLKNLKLNLK
jgi:hypothetical protein